MRMLPLSIAMVLLAAAGAAAPSSVKDWLDASATGALAATPTAFRAIPEKTRPALVPTLDLRDAFCAEVAAFGANYAGEMLRIIPAKGATLLDLANAAASISTLKGIPYWSVTRQKTWTLFAESYTVQSPQNPVRVPDPVFDAVPRETRFYSLQEDTTFGRNVYEATFRGGRDYLWTRTENVTPISFLLVPIIPQGGFLTHTILVPADDGLIYYSVAMMRGFLPGVNKQSRLDSLKNRLVAMADWLQERLSK